MKSKGSAARTTSNIVEITPGQLWSWSFAVGDGTWLIEKVNDSRRNNSYYSGAHVIIRRGDTFVIIATNVGAPLNSITQIAYMQKPYCIALLHGNLVWMDSNIFELSTLIA